jgi:hypothetical protein
MLVGCVLGVGSRVEGTEVVGVFVVSEGRCDVYRRGDICVVVQKGVCVQNFRCERDVEVDVEVIEFGCGWGFGGVVVIDASMVGAIGGCGRHGAIASSIEDEVARRLKQAQRKRNGGVGARLLTSLVCAH